MSTLNKDDIMGVLDTRQIHELEALTSMSGREQILIDDGTVTRSVTVDGLLGYFSSRFVGNEDNEIDITALNSASCIHLIKPGEDIPTEERIKGHFYLKLSEQVVDKIYDAIKQDHEQTKYYLETGKKNITGLLFPDHYYINDEDYKFVKLLTIEVDDPKQSVYINETFDLNLVNQVSDGYMYSKFNKVHLEFLYSSSTQEIVEDSIVLTANDLSNSSNNKSISRLLFIKDNATTASIWLEMDNVNMVLINRTFSLAIDKAPENASHIQTNYHATYIDNNTVDADTELAILEDTLGTKIAETVDANSFILKKINALENAIIKADLDVKFNSVTFNTINPVDTIEQQMISTLIRTIDSASVFLIINDDGTVSVSKDGYYSLSLKQGFKVVQGSSDLTLNVYVNSSKIEDLTSTVSLSESFNFQYSTGQVALRLQTTDKIKVTSKWSNTNIDLINNTALQVIKYLDCAEDLDFGTVGSEIYPYVGIARVGSARLLLGISGEGDDLTVATYTMPYVDVAAVEESRLKIK